MDSYLNKYQFEAQCCGMPLGAYCVFSPPGSVSIMLEDMVIEIQ